ncbi:MAG: DUF192 domain-containing protein [Bacteroidota bacterium]
MHNEAVYLRTSALIINIVAFSSACSYNPTVNIGELLFFVNSLTKKVISISSIETNAWISHQHLTYQDTMPDSCGMFYIFESEAIQPFHLKAGHQAFDILFIAPNNKIISIKKNVLSSFSQIQPSENTVLYSQVLLVNAGFCDKNSIFENDSISFLLTKECLAK